MHSNIVARAMRRAVLGTIAAAALSCGAQAEPSTTIKLLTADIQVAADGTSTQAVHYEIRANNDAAAMGVGQTSVPYDASTQTLKVVEAHTLKADGRTVPVNIDAIYDSMPNGGGQMAAITNMRVKVIVFPQFSAGDTAVYSVLVTSKLPFFPGKYWYGEAYSRAIAYDEVRETITAPRSMPLFVENHGVDFSKASVGNNVVYSWHYAAPTPTPPELHMVSPLESAPRFLVSSFKDYAEIGRVFAAVSKPMMTPTPAVTALAGQITQGVAGRREQVRAITEWVSRHIRYVAIELGRGSYVPHTPDAVLANGYGDCKDHVVLLGALLKAKGIESESLLINGTNEYELPQVPTFATLDHVITWVPEFNLYLDSSVPVAPFGVLPLEEYGKPVIRATLENAGVAALPVVAAGETSVALTTEAHFDKAGQLIGTTTTTATGPYAILLRFMGLGIQNVGAEAAATQQLASLGYSGATGTFEVGTPADFTPSYAITGTFVSPGWNDRLTGSDPFFMPGGMRLLGLSGDGPMGPFNPGALKDGESVVCLSAHMSEDLSLQAPDGLHFAQLPHDENISTASIRFTAHWLLRDGTISVHRDFTSTIGKPLCSADMRRQNAAALKSISDSYNVTLTLAR